MYSVNKLYPMTHVHQADVFARDTHGDMALHWACRMNRTLIVRTLLVADPGLETPLKANYKQKTPVELCSK